MLAPTAEVRGGTHGELEAEALSHLDGRAFEFFREKVPWPFKYHAGDFYRCGQCGVVFRVRRGFEWALLLGWTGFLFVPGLRMLPWGWSLLNKLIDAYSRRPQDFYLIVAVYVVGMAGGLFLLGCLCALIINDWANRVAHPSIHHSRRVQRSKHSPHAFSTPLVGQSSTSRFS